MSRRLTTVDDGLAEAVPAPVPEPPWTLGMGDNPRVQQVVEAATHEGVRRMKCAQELVRLAKAVMSGTETRTIKGTGWTKEEALKNALKADEEYHGHGEGYGGGAGSLRQVVRSKMVKEPRQAKRVSIERAQVRKGPVEKKFIIERKWGFDRAEPVDRDPRYRARYDTQGEVLRAAKELALQYGTVLVITLAAFCVGNTQLAVVTPEKAEPGEWLFECDFRS